MNEQKFYTEKIEQKNEKPLEIGENVYFYKNKKEVEVFDENWTVCFVLKDGKLILHSQENNGGDRYETELPIKTINFLLNKAKEALDSYNKKHESLLSGAQNKIDEEAMRIFGRPYNELTEEEIVKLSDYA